MNRIAIDVNDVLRDTFLKLEETYTKFVLNDEELMSGDFEYGLNLPVTTIDLINHFKFKNNEELFEFMFLEHPMIIFGHAPSKETHTFNYINEFYKEHRKDSKITIISQEVEKSKPATLFFISKFGCLVENYRFYSNFTLLDVINENDFIVTTNREILLNHKEKAIKFETEYNKDIECEHTIKSISELNKLFIKIKNYG